MKSVSVPINDILIRQAMRARLAIAHAGEDAVVVDELKVCRGSCRMDLAVINGRIEGYEIKSDRDALDRLSRQAEMFGRVADRMTLVVGQRHHKEASRIIPDWWSILVVTERSDGTLKFACARKGRLNKTREKRALVEVLERSEILAMMSSHGIDKGYRTSGYSELAERSREHISGEDIGAFVKKMLKIRARVAAEFGDNAFGRNAIICSTPSA